jgi:hypothetical protein
MSLISKILSGVIAFTAGLSQVQTNGSASEAHFEVTRTDNAQKFHLGDIERPVASSPEGAPTCELDRSCP